MARTRYLSLLVAGALGVGVAAAVAAQDGGVPACANKKTGKIRDTARNGGCRASDFLITISGNAFKKAKGGTLTINGVAFKGPAPRSGTLPNTLTINGNTFRTGTLPNSLTINGTSFESGARGTVTINGTPLTGTLPAGSQGPEGKVGPTGPAWQPAVTVDAPTVARSVTGGSGPQPLASQEVTGTNRRLLVTGGANLVCNPCPEAVAPTVGISGPTDVIRRQTAPFATTAMVSVAEVVVCGPCTVTLQLSVPAGAGGQAATVDASAVRLAVVDLGPA